MPYYSTSDGGVAFRDTPDPVAKEGWNSISPAAYDTKKAELDQAADQLERDLVEAKSAQASSDFAALTELGIPADLASRLTGHKVSN